MEPGRGKRLWPGKWFLDSLWVRLSWEDHEFLTPSICIALICVCKWRGDYLAYVVGSSWVGQGRLREWWTEGHWQGNCWSVGKRSVVLLGEGMSQEVVCTGLEKMWTVEGFWIAKVEWGDAGAPAPQSRRRPWEDLGTELLGGFLHLGVSVEVSCGNEMVEAESLTCFVT
jgi:hypothetical protein